MRLKMGNDPTVIEVALDPDGARKELAGLCDCGFVADIELQDGV
jgi:hypothetical protein